MLQDIRLIYKSQFLFYIPAWIGRIWNLKYIIYISTLQNEILRYKSNKICIRSIWGKLHNSDELNQRINSGTPCSWIGSLNIVMVSVLPNLTYRFNAIRIKIPASYFVGIDKVTPKFIWRVKRHIITNTVLK